MTFSASPVSEIAFGVRRDSISRLRASSRRAAARSARVVVMAGRYAGTRASWPANAQAAGRARARARAVTAATAATHAPRKASVRKWLAVATITKVITNG